MKAVKSKIHGGRKAAGKSRKSAQSSRIRQHYIYIAYIYKYVYGENEELPANGMDTYANISQRRINEYFETIQFCGIHFKLAH